MSQTVHQQQGGMSLSDFAKLNGKTAQQLQRLAKAGRIIGARKHPVTHKWWIYPPAQIVKGWHW